MLYFLIVSCTMIVCEILTISVSLISNSFSLTYAIIAPFFVNFYALLILGVLGLLFRLVLPKRLLNYQNKYFKVTENEFKRLEKLGVKRWKDKVPDMGCAVGFPKDKLTSLEKKYLTKFLEETCFAEVLHGLTGILGFTALFFFPFKYYYFVLIILIVNLFLHILPCLIQRYNRYRLAKIYELKYKN